MRVISEIKTCEDWMLKVSFTDGAVRLYDVKPLLASEAFTELKDPNLFKRVRNCSYFIEWENEADLSSDTLYLEGKAVSH